MKSASEAILDSEEKGDNELRLYDIKPEVVAAATDELSKKMPEVFSMVRNHETESPALNEDAYKECAQRIREFLWKGNYVDSTTKLELLRFEIRKKIRLDLGLPV